MAGTQPKGVFSHIFFIQKLAFVLSDNIYNVVFKMSAEKTGFKT
jgi:hypothetical protein